MNPLSIDPNRLPVVSGEQIPGSLSQAMLLVILLGALAYLLLQHGVVKSKAVLVAGLGVFALAIALAFTVIPLQLDAIVRMCFCVLAVGGGMAFITAREPVHAALGFATSVLSACGILFMQYAYFIAAATMIVYAGATIIIFLFVLMFAQKSKLRTYDIQLTNPLVATIVSAALMFAIAWSVAEPGEVLPIKVDVTRPYSLAVPGDAPGEKMPPTVLPGMSAQELEAFVPAKTSGLGRSMFTDYLLAVELAGTVLLVATIGAIVLAQRTERDAA